MRSEVIFLSWWDLAGVSALLAVSGLVSLFLRLRLESHLYVASLRTVVQLIAVGFVLKWVFALQSVYLVAAVLLTMTALAALHAIRRSPWSYRGCRWVSFVSLAVSTAVSAFLVTHVIVGVKPWYDPQYVIPLVGMILGNSLSGISLAIDRFLTSLREEAKQIEERLCLGATNWEAARPMVRRAIYSGHIPILNSMSVAGIVSLPGMMTGQLLAGSDPMVAIRYQIVVMFMIAAACSLGTTLFVLWTTRRLFTPWHQLDVGAIRRTGN